MWITEIRTILYPNNSEKIGERIERFEPKKGFDFKLEQEVEARFLAWWGEDGSKRARVEARFNSKFFLRSQLLFTV